MRSVLVSRGLFPIECCGKLALNGRHPQAVCSAMAEMTSVDTALISSDSSLKFGEDMTLTHVTPLETLT
jgi:hypothetical protein